MKNIKFDTRGQLDEFLKNNKLKLEEKLSEGALTEIRNHTIDIIVSGANVPQIEIEKNLDPPYLVIKDASGSPFEWIKLLTT